MATASGTPGGEGNVPGRAILIIRLRGVQNLNPKTKDTLKYMRLNRVNHAVVLPETPTTKGMLQVGKDYVTWGEVDAQTLASVIANRGRLVGDKPITDAHVAKGTPFKTIQALADAIVAGKFHYNDVPDVKPIFRLHPARKGLEGIKRSVAIGGALGYRGKDINELLGRMVGAEGATAGKPTKGGA
ncbi:MAG: 50S ribosomal protein L30 [Candidatus Thermoplasmatota archaeon]